MKKVPFWAISLIQALGITAYCFFVGTFMLNAEKWFGPMPRLFGPTLFLMLFVVSAATCGFIFGGYAFVLFWDKKQTKDAIKLVGYTIGWLALLTVIVSTLLITRII